MQSRGSIVWYAHRCRWTNTSRIFISFQALYQLISMTNILTRQLVLLLILSAILIIPPVSSFIVEKPTATINPIGDHHIGDKFTITGSTNLAVGDYLSVEIYSSSFKPTQKEQSSQFSGSSGTVTVIPGTNRSNIWSFDVDTSAFKPDEYIIKVSGITNEVTAFSTFIILEPLPLTTIPTVKTQTTTLQTASPITTTPSPLPTKSPPSPITIFVAFGLFGYAMILKRK